LQSFVSIKYLRSRFCFKQEEVNSSALELKVTEGIGERIKLLRQKRQFTLAKLAEKSNLSASHLSQIERKKTSPSLITLNSIAQALDVNLRDLFESDQDQVYVTHTNPALVDNGSSLPMWPLTKHSSGWDLQVYRLSLSPDAAPLNFESYSGEILLLVLEGSLQITIDGEQFELQAGDSLHADARQPHRLGCTGDQLCTVIWCNSPPREDIAIRERG
jgi:quercetin dioxygenase-like cupin family protein/DNA-binding XRE family transcriptional regulator